MTRDFVMIEFKLYCLPTTLTKDLENGESMKIGIMGSIPELGSWKTGQMLTATKCQIENNVWRVISRVPISSTFRWSWVVTTNNNRVLNWDPARNRQTSVNFFNGILQATWGLTQTCFISKICAVSVRTQYVCQAGESLVLTGSEPSLGSWEPKTAIRAKECPANSSYWVAEALLDSSVSYQWKWLVLDSKTGNAKRWEEKRNRCLRTNCEKLVIDARWNSDTYIRHRIPVARERNIDMAKQNISNYEMITTKAAKDVATKWISNVHYNETYYAETEADNPVIKRITSTRKPTWRSFIRQLSSLLPSLDFTRDWWFWLE